MHNQIKICNLEKNLHFDLSFSGIQSFITGVVIPIAWFIVSQWNDNIPLKIKNKLPPGICIKKT